MKILQKSKQVERREYTLNFDRIDDPGSGLAFLCDSNGMLFKFNSEEAARNYKHGYRSGLYHRPYVEEHVNRRMEPTEIECDCGRAIELPDLTNECGNCGRLWNWAAQRLNPVHMWGEETGEHWADVARSF